MMNYQELYRVLKPISGKISRVQFLRTVITKDGIAMAFPVLLISICASGVKALRPVPLTMIEHAMPLMAPHRYEAALRAAVKPQGEIIRWAITRVDEASSTAFAEVVIEPRPVLQVKRPGMRRMLGIDDVNDVLAFSSSRTKDSSGKGLRSTQQLPTEYRNRWKSEPTDGLSPAPPSSTKGPFYTMDDVMCWSEDAGDSAEIMCIAATDEKAAVGLCGPSSFDSTEDGMICIEDPESGSLKWICM